MRTESEIRDILKKNMPIIKRYSRKYAYMDSYEDRMQEALCVLLYPLKENKENQLTNFLKLKL